MCGLEAEVEWKLVLSLRKQQPMVFLRLLMRNHLGGFSCCRAGGLSGWLGS